MIASAGLAALAAPSRPLSSTLWLVAPRLLRLATGLFVGVWVARHLGPERWGVLSYALAFAGLLAPLSRLGLDGFLVRDLVRRPAAAGRILGTGLALRGLATPVYLGATLGLVAFLRPGETTLLLLATVFSLHFVFRTSEILEFWFRARMQTRWIALAQGAGLALGAGLSITLVLADAPLVLFALPFALEAALAAGVALQAYLRTRGRPTRWSVSLPRARRLLGESWPLVLSGAAAMALLQIDQIMLGQLLDDEAVGIYSSVVRVSAAAYFVPMLTCQALQPVIVRARDAAPAEYASLLQTLFTLLAALAWATAAVVALVATPLVGLLYGEAFAEGGPVLALHIFGFVFICVGAPRGLWVTNESFARFALASNLAGAGMNVALNLVLIPAAGVRGAAYATLASYLLANVLTTACFRPAWPIFGMQLRALLLLDLSRAWRQRSAFAGAAV